MADGTQQDKTLEKAVWRYTGIGILWIALVLSGMALERLGLTTWVLGSILPGQVGSLQTQAAECRDNFDKVKFERDITVRTVDTLRVEIAKLQKKVTALEQSQASSRPTGETSSEPSGEPSGK